MADHKTLHAPLRPWPRSSNLSHRASDANRRYRLSLSQRRLVVARTPLQGTRPFINGQKSLKGVLLPALEELANRSLETSFFVSASEHGNSRLDFAMPKRGANVFIHPGFEFRIHATAAGKVIHAFSGQEVPDLPANCALTQFQPATITDPARLMAVLNEVRAVGYAVNDNELDEDAHSVCVPVFYKESLTGALGVIGPKSRIFAAAAFEVGDLVPVLKQVAAEVSSLLSKP